MIDTTEKTLDTNILLHDYRAIEALEVDIRIPLTVIREAENHKKDAGEVGWNARKSLKLIERSMGTKDAKDMLPNGKSLYIDIEGESELDLTINDHKIIHAAKEAGTILVTNDVAMRIIARVHNVECEGYAGDEAEINLIGRIETIEAYPPVVDMLYEKRNVPLEMVKSNNKAVNACMVIREGQKSVLARRMPDRIQKITPPEDIQGISGKNVGQKFYLDMLLDQILR